MRFEARPARTRILNVKLTDDELHAFKAAAVRAGAASASDYLRRLMAVAVASQ